MDTESGDSNDEARMDLGDALKYEVQNSADISSLSSGDSTEKSINEGSFMSNIQRDSQSRSPQDELVPLCSSKACTDTGGGEVQSQSTTDAQHSSTNTAITSKEICRKEMDAEKDKAAPKTMAQSPKKGTKRKVDKFKLTVKSARLQHVFIEECETGDETLQMDPEVKRRMLQCLNSNSDLPKLIVIPGSKDNAKSITEKNDAPKSLIEKYIKTVGAEPTVKRECPKCMEKFHSLKHFNAHSCSNEVQGRGLYSCTDCRERFDTKAHLMDHMHAMHQPKPRRRFTCRYCQMVFSQRSVLTNHERSVHRTQMVFSCEHCSLSFNTKGCLSRHEKQMGHGMWHAVPPQTTQAKMKCLSKFCFSK